MDDNDVLGVLFLPSGNFLNLMSFQERAQIDVCQVMADLLAQAHP